ncbi:NADH-quinone oxidoreductase subunit H, partial [Ciceribacter ferrooxidans]
AAGPFALFFLAEYANIIIINTLSVVLFIGSTHSFIPELSTVLLILKAALLTAVFI